jgi:hypothetical protein
MCVWQTCTRVENHGYLKCAVGAGLMYFIYLWIMFDETVGNSEIYCRIVNWKWRGQKLPWPVSTYCPGIGLGVPKNPTKTATIVRRGADKSLARHRDVVGWNLGRPPDFG